MSHYSKLVLAAARSLAATGLNLSAFGGCVKIREQTMTEIKRKVGRDEFTTLRDLRK